MFNFSEDNDFEDIMERLLARVDDSLDKRQGSIIYDALAPAAAELAQCYIALDVYADQTYLANAVGDNLDNRVADFGITRYPATYSKRYIDIYNSDSELMDVEIGTRLAVPNEYGGYNYELIEKIETGKYIAQCETAGSDGNEYTGELLPLESVNNLGSAILGDIYTAGEDEETDEHLRERTIEKITKIPFGGNIADYKQFVEAVDGIGDCLVIPVWDGGGTVKIVVVTSDYQIPSTTAINELQTLLDPIQNSGEGLGEAPIGHTVTVAAPTAYQLYISCSISIDSQYTLSGLEDNIIASINTYIRQVQKQWSDNDTLIIYISRMIAAIVTVEGVINVESLTINGSSSDITIDVTSEGNPFPMVEEVVINES